MFWNKKLPRARKGDLLEVETAIIIAIIEALSNTERLKLNGQLPYLKLLKRIELETSIVLEFYPESMDSIPNELLFENKGEYIMAEVKYKNGGLSFSTKACNVLGSLFYLKTKPNYVKAGKTELSEFQVENIKILPAI